MNFPTPRIINISSHTDALTAGCDCVMIKHDGWPVAINCNHGIGNVYSNFRFGYTPDTPQELLEQTTCIDPIDALFIGAKNRLNPVIYLYDMWWHDGKDLQNFTYRERYVLMRINARALDERFQLVQTYPAQAAQELWREVVLGGHKGLVYRRSKDTAAGELYVMRHYVESPKEFV